MLKQVHFQGIKSLLDVSVELEPFTVLVGPNGCGKSTFLDQIDALCAMSHADGSSSNALGRAGEVLAAMEVDALKTGGGGGGQMWEATSNQGRFLHVGIGDADGKPWYTRAQLVASADGDRKALGYQSAADSRLALEALLSTKLAWPGRKLRLQASAIALPAPLSADPFDGLSMGFGLPGFLARLGINDQESFQAIQADLRTVVVHFERLHLDTVAVRSAGGGTQDGLALSLVFRGAGRVPARFCSEGTLLALGVLSAMRAAEKGVVITLDDLDHGLHLGAQYEIVEAIRRVMAARPELQVICTTHSPVLLDSFKPEEVRVMALDESGHTLVSKLTDHPSFEKYNKLLQTGELWATTGEDWVRHAHAGK